ncbi:PPIase cyclophilin-type domain-containing protein [[Candida] zeylanoides]
MSLEPPPNAEVVLRTSKGDLAIELWTKEAPQTCRRFIERCRAGAYVGQAFGRISKQSLIQVDDPRARFDLPLETHARLKFGARGMLGAVRGDAASTVDSFFVTCRAAPELNGTHTVFGRVVGASYYTVVAIHDGEVGSDGESPVFPVAITASEVKREAPAAEATTGAPQPQEAPPAPKTEAPVAAPRRPKVKLSLDFEDDAEVPLKVRSAFEPLRETQRVAAGVAKEAGGQHTSPTAQSPETPQGALGVERASESAPGGQDAAMEGAATEGAATEGAAAEGAFTEGTATEGAAAESAATEGAAAEGASTEGTATEGAAAESAATDGADAMPAKVDVTAGSNAAVVSAATAGDAAAAPSAAAAAPSAAAAAPSAAAAARRGAPDPIDSDYDPYLDLASEEEISPSATLTHVWP